jgi:NTP pyrophosphatase (non-canonical NTP hydrolase)
MENRQESILQKIRSFRDERDWQEFHTPKNLAISISIESGELLENYQWTKPDDSPSVKQLENIKHELADIYIYLSLLADGHEIDLLESVEQKLILNNEKYPIDKARGNAKKYTCKSSK